MMTNVQLNNPPTGLKRRLAILAVLCAALIGPHLTEAQGDFAQTPKHHIKRPALEIRLQSGDFEEYGNTWIDHTPAQVTFRWEHELTGFNVVHYEVREEGQDENSPPVRYDSVTHQPTQGVPSLFTIDFHDVVDESQRPVTYYVKLVFSVANIATQTVTRIAESNAVAVTITEEQPGHPINVPRFWVTIERIEIVDDSDDWGDGEFGFAFWLEYAGGRTGRKYFNGSAGTGENLYPFALYLTLDNPPQSVSIHAYGFDDDESEAIPYLHVIMFTMTTCGMQANPGSSSDDCPKDDNYSKTFVETGSAFSVQQASQPFVIHALGMPFSFRVHGSYELLPETAYVSSSRN